MDQLTGFLTLSLVKAAPLIFAALGGVVCERAGILNIALEGQLTVGAFTAVVVSFVTGSPILGLAAGIAAGALCGWLLGFAATRFNVNQIVAGTGINLLALGGCAFGLTVVFGQPGASAEVHALGRSGEYALILVAFLAAAGLHVALNKTRWGLRTRAAGENPHALASASVDPRRVRVLATILGGALAGLGGAYLSIGELDLYSDGMTAGRGFIALAAVIFGRWTPLGATGASIGFGALAALQFVLQRSGIPSELMQALPYLAALAALTGITGRARAPKADGIPYTG
ncbi:MAG: ABC transporter permease [Candidatus Eremiobacteraeota bacterium]|nr:ABC transporter permease [Candidatus Eremiobacteraeota bacterium]